MYTHCARCHGTVLTDSMIRDRVAGEGWTFVCSDRAACDVRLSAYLPPHDWRAINTTPEIVAEIIAIRPGLTYDAPYFSFLNDDGFGGVCVLFRCDRCGAYFLEDDIGDSSALIVGRHLADDPYHVCIG